MAKEQALHVAAHNLREAARSLTRALAQDETLADERAFFQPVVEALELAATATYKLYGARGGDSVICMQLRAELSTALAQLGVALALLTKYRYGLNIGTEVRWAEEALGKAWLALSEI